MAWQLIKSLFSPAEKPAHTSVDELFQAAMQKHQEGRLEEAAANYRFIIKRQPEHSAALHYLGVIAYQQGNFDNAVKLIEKAISISPGEQDFYNSCGSAYRSLEQYSDAKRCFSKVLELNPESVEAHFNLAVVLRENGDTGEALDCFRQCLALGPQNPDLLVNIGLVLTELNQLKDAISCFRQVIEMNPDSVEACNNLGSVLRGMGEAEEAIVWYEKAIANRAELPEAHNNLALTLLDLGHADRAMSHFEKALAIKPGFAEARYNLVNLEPQTGDINSIETLLEDDDISDSDASYYHFALGDIHDSAGSYARAFEHYTRANSFKRKTTDYDAGDNSARIDRLVSVFSAEFFTANRLAGSDSELPVFIVGMPRSGTTLVEQIIASHPAVIGAGELGNLYYLEDALARHFASEQAYPDCVPQLQQAEVEEYAQHYLQQLPTPGTLAKRLSDKTPGNFLRLGLVKLLFPRARIIHCQRNAMDTCLSIFTHNFVTRDNEYSFDLEELAKFYLDYEKLMRHWKGVFGDQVLDVQYEELVREQEKGSRRLIDYLGLDWDDNCLAFYRNQRAVRTASKLQVRQPIYTTAINRWKRYESELAPLAAHLQGLV